MAIEAEDFINRSPGRPVEAALLLDQRQIISEAPAARPTLPAQFTHDPADAAPMPGITAIVPAYDEAESITETVLSLRAQTYPVAEIIVVDDCSTDDTAAVARRLGVTVLTPPKNTGSKAGAQNFAMPFVATEYCMAIDADTELAPDAVEKLVAALNPPGVAAVCGFVLPRYVRSVWERGRYIEYLFAFNFYKPIQDFLGRPLISSGCFSAYRTAILRSVGGWSTRTMAEDMDLTWTLYHRGHQVRFVGDALCYPIEPHDFNFLSKQLRRWSHGFVQNVRLHWREVVPQPYLRSILAVGYWDAIISSIAYLILIPLLMLIVHPVMAVAYVIDLPAVAIPVLVKAWQRREFGRALLSLPCFLIVRLVNSYFILCAVWSEYVLGKTLLVYEKGH
ncbi:glycosyltransferase family 2 protein [Allosphingosinicella flava]|uniref:Glycosyltransferase family 2 protein n=1 Tax=Allosphingosinicella flava TaxID=2771430 RepID=A0A7T2GJY3_9SPHN|nr:glycosyltransferase family 2 protein [Sphingosinicella flava]QPQ55250.1 glycosyltransferase family 2 protein [Sphingosinicella flava]